MARGKQRPGEVRYTDEIGCKICALLAQGRTLRSICRQSGMPHESSVRGWARDPKHPFAPQYARAREIGFHSMADEIMDIVDDATKDWVERKGKDGETELVLDREHIQR